jgi:predicted kinase
MRTQTVYFLKGLPASGKSTWSKEKIEENRQNGIITKRVNKDDLRAMMDNSIHSKEREKFVNKIQYLIITEAIEDGYDVIVDNTNFNPVHKKKLEEIIDERNRFFPWNEQVELEEIFFDTPLQECIKRDFHRDNSVGEKVIRNMYNQYLKKENVPTIKYNPDLPSCVIVDVDGTLAIRKDRNPYEYWKAGNDELNVSVANLLCDIQKQNKDLVTIIMTGRENLCDEDGYTISDLTQTWLIDNHISFDEIHIRKNGDHRPDFEVKKEMYEKNIKENYNVLYVIDDRRQVIDMWREQGLMVLDVAGNDF